MRKCVIIMNPASGKKRKIDNFKDFYDISRKYGYDTEIIFTKAKHDATRIVKELDNDVDLVISAGGDGTLNEIVTGNSERLKKLMLADLPMGTTNDVGKMYGLNKSVYQNLEKILMGKPKKIDVCYINNSPFIYVACLGDYIDMAYNTPRELKKKYGKIAYIMYGLKQLRNKINRYDIRYKVNGKTYEGKYSFIFITNSSRVAGVSDIYYDVKLDDNRFEVALADIKTKKDMLKMLVLISTIDVKDIPGITYYRTNNFDIEFLNVPKTSWCIDGEEYRTDAKKFHFEVEQNMTMLMPNERIKKLFQYEDEN